MSELGQKLISIVREKAAENPDFVYEPPNGDTCVYVHNGQPSCIIGHALWGVGFNHILQTPSPHGGHPMNEETFNIVSRHLSLDLDSKEVQWLRDVQSKQDTDICWCDAVEYADSRMELLSHV